VITELTPERQAIIITQAAPEDDLSGIMAVEG